MNDRLKTALTILLALALLVLVNNFGYLVKPFLQSTESTVQEQQLEQQEEPWKKKKKPHQQPHKEAGMIDGV